MKYVPDHVGTGAYLKSSPELRALLEQRAHLGLAVGRALAPHRTGKLAASGHVESGDLGMQRHNDRMVFSVVFDIPYAAAATWPSRTAYLDAVKAAMEGGR
jgi:hypothetical protein